MKINILGTEYSIITGNERKYPKLTDKFGYCDISSKQIVISDMATEAGDFDALDNMQVFKNKVTRHEIIHAMLYESGLHECSDFGMNEEMVDWMAIQAPKLAAVFKQAKVL